MTEPVSLHVVAKRRRYTRRQKAAAVVTAELSSTLAAAEATGVPESTIRYWLDDPRFAKLREKTREQAADGFDVLIHMAQDRLTELLPTMEARDVITLMGVATDKAQLVSGHATARTETKALTDGLDDHEKDALTDAIDDWLKERAEA